MTEAELAEIEARTSTLESSVRGLLPRSALRYEPTFFAQTQGDRVALVAEVRALKAMLRGLEWGSCDGCLARKAGSCLVCGADAESLQLQGNEVVNTAGKHLPDCALAAAMR